MDELDDFIALLGLPIQNKPLLTEALTHSSWINEHGDALEETADDNERLEFLGDAVLDLVVGAYLFGRFPKMREGEMTTLRAALVRAETLAEFARKLKIDEYLLLGYGETETGGRTKTAMLCAAFEAVIGALYLDVGLTHLTRLIERLIEPTLQTILDKSLHKDPKSEFQTFAQAKFGHTPYYTLVGEDGPDHEKTFTLHLFVDDEIWGEGRGSSKRRAEMEAARAGLMRAGLQIEDRDKN